jgi:acetyl-CoA C-acetyltransferase
VPDAIDPARTPVLVGIGVVMQREDDPLRAMDPLALMTEAARRAGADAAGEAGGDAGAAGLLAGLDRILVPRGRWSHSNPGRAIGAAIGAPGVHSVMATVGVLQQTLFGAACAAIAAGEICSALVVGGDAGYRLLRARITGTELPAPPDGDDGPDQLLAPKEELRHPAELRAGLRMPVGLYAILESAYRARQGLSVAAHRDRIAALYARLSAVAAGNPDAWTRTPYDAATIRNASARNPMQAFPYTKLHCSSWNVDQAAALLFCSAARAAALGVPRDRWVHPWSSTDSNHMVPVSARADLAVCPGAAIAGRMAIEPFGIGPGDLDRVDLYSCFPVAIETYAAALGLDLDRDLTVTGGMSYGGGPYNNYVLQSTAKMGRLLRGKAGQKGLVSSVSGVLTKQGFGLWSSDAPPGGFRSVDVTDGVARETPEKRVVADYRGPARVAGFTVLHDPERPPLAIAVADLEDGTRALATNDDPAVVARFEAEEFVGAALDVDGERFRLVAGP